MKLVRLGRRRAVGEGESAEEFLQIEFRARDGGLDLNPSVYATDGSSEKLIQIHAEHAASFLQSPPRGGQHFMVEAIADHRVNATTGRTRFLYTRYHHKELVFDDPNQLREFAAALHDALSSRARSTTLAELARHVRAELDAASDEWRLFVEDATTSPAWKKLAGAG